MSIENDIKKLGQWYQRIKIDDIYTSNRKKREDSDLIWGRINSFISKNIKGKKILDLGCNAGYYSIMAAKNGASVVAIESLEKAYNQFKFLKDYYEKLWNTKLDITFIQKDISDIDFKSLGKFDYIFALSVLYHVGNHKFGKGTKEALQEQSRIISILSKMSDTFIVRARKRKRTNSEFYDAKHYNKVFGKYGFLQINKIEEKGNRTLILYRK